MDLSLTFNFASLIATTAAIISAPKWVMAGVGTFALGAESRARLREANKRNRRAAKVTLALSLAAVSLQFAAQIAAVAGV